MSWISDLLNNMNFDRWLAVIATILAVLSLYVAWFFFRKAFSSKSLSYGVILTPLISKSRNILPKEVTILFNAREVEGLAKVNYILWNSGLVTINGDDLASNQRLIIRAGWAVQFLKVSVERMSIPENKINLTLNPDVTNEVFCSFSYLDPGQGANIALLYTGRIQEFPLEGVIKGIPNGITKMENIQNVFYSRENFKSEVILSIIMSGGFFLFITFQYIYEGEISYITALSYLLMLAIFMIMRNWRRFIYRRIPNLIEE